jgi:hypothetical protein
MDWNAFQACLEYRLTGKAVNNEETIEKYVEELTRAIQDAMQCSANKSRPRGDKMPLLPTSIHDSVRLNKRVKRQW